MLPVSEIPVFNKGKASEDRAPDRCLFELDLPFIEDACVAEFVSRVATVSLLGIIY